MTKILILVCYPNSTGTKMINNISCIRTSPRTSKSNKSFISRLAKGNSPLRKLPSILFATSGMFIGLNVVYDKLRPSDSEDISLNLDKVLDEENGNEAMAQYLKKGLSCNGRDYRYILKGIDIDALSGRAKKIGVKVDRANVEDNKLKGEEVGLFFDECSAKKIVVEREPWFSRGNTAVLYDNYQNFKRMISGDRLVCEPDALRVSVRTHYRFPAEYKKDDVLVNHADIADRIADSWAEAFNIDNSDGTFTDFVEKLYDVAKELNVTKPNSKYNPKYPRVEDQVVDELLGAFANESKFNPEATSADGLYHGIFQFSEVGMKDLENKHTHLPIISMEAFERLSRVEQLDYMLEAGKVSKKYYSKLGDAPISPKQVYAMWKFPVAGNPDAKIKYAGKVHVGRVVQNEKANVISLKQKCRGEIEFKRK